MAIKSKDEHLKLQARLQENQMIPKEEVKTTRSWHLDAVIDIVWPLCFENYNGTKLQEIGFTKTDPVENQGEFI